ncbi:unnamed protein product [Rotaria sp. Silwood2]|nr:unnamed protein product [Rotaria sp. Silwood2]CAF3060304.1 unnamed protein product [Rotaria sp. Silwood2]CAF4014133.1 unnamed protein product [Rotaria sp. Silwood2]CAF4141022.1 unnamed protein product [Rotaria sp. Silwood2]CAF4292035.1 unnamed protein product [Rotaria sp. Silwood2]
MNTSFSNELQQLQMELRAQNFDIIRFSTYRTACKLRFIQKKLNFHLLDLLNVIESLRECLTWPSSELSSNSLSPTSRRTPTPIHTSLSNNDQYLSVNRLTAFLTSIYTNLNKRLPSSQQILHIDNCVHSAIAWFLYVYNNNNNNELPNNNISIRFNSFRVVLVLLCTGKLVDKMRHLFTSYLSSSMNALTYGQIDELLHEILALPYALQEISYSTYRSNNAQLMFSHLSTTLVNLDDFLDTLIYNDTTPNCLQWLIIFHRLISVENVIHRVKCSGCQRASFSGFRYKCQQCHDRTYQLCQDCFWRGRVSDQHLPTHEMKEYTFFTSPVKEFRQSIRRSFQCMPKNEERRPNTTSSSSSSPRFFSWKCRNSSTKRNQQLMRQHQPVQPQQQQNTPVSVSSPSSPLMIEKEQISSCSSPQLIRLSTPKPSNLDEQRSLLTTKTDIKKIDENGNDSDMDEHVQIAYYAQQLASIGEKQKHNPTGIQPPIRFSSCPMNLQTNNQYYSRMTATTPSAIVPMSSIRSMHMDHQSAEKRLIISKLEAQNRRILREINTLRTQLKRRNSLDYANSNLPNDFHAYSDTDAYTTGLYPSSSGLSSSMNRLEQRYTQTLPHQRTNPHNELSSYHQYQQSQSTRSRIHQMRRAGSTETNPYLEQELQTLLSRKHQLESRIDHLQQSREELTTQLDTLGKILRYSPNTQQRSSTMSPNGRLSVSPSRMVYHTHGNTSNTRKINPNVSFRSYSTPPTPLHDLLTPTETSINEPISISQHTKSLRTDLLIAADSLTSAMSSLVQQLNTESSESLPTTVNNTPSKNGYNSTNDNKTNFNDKLLPKTSITSSSTNNNNNPNDIIENDSGSRTDEESLLTSDDEDDDERREERTTDDDLLRTTDDDDAGGGGGGGIAQAINSYSLSSTKRIEPLTSEQQQ